MGVVGVHAHLVMPEHVLQYSDQTITITSLTNLKREDLGTAMVLVLTGHGAVLAGGLVGLPLGHRQAIRTPALSVLARQSNQSQYPLQSQVGRVNKSLFTNSTRIFLPAGSAVDVTLPALYDLTLDDLTTATAGDLPQQLLHHQQAVHGNLAT